MAKYDVFVSYRRSSFDSVYPIVTRLRAAGYRVFFDLETLRSGPFNEQLYSVIESCADFVLVLPPGALDRCVNEDDWVRKEVLHAMKHNKNIVPVMLAGFDWPDPMPEGMEKLALYQSLSANRDFFDLAMKKLESYLKSRKKTRSRLALRWTLGIICALLLITVSSRFILRSTSAELCEQVVAHLSAKVSAADILLSDNAFLRELIDESDNSLARDVQDKIELVIEDVTQLEQLSSATGLELSVIQGLQLSLFGVSDLDIVAFDEYSQSLYLDMLTNIKTLMMYYSDGEIVPSEKAFALNLTQSFEHSVNAMYFNYLQILNNLPQSSLVQYWDLAEKLENMPKTGLGLDDKEYDVLMQREFEAFEDINDQMNAIVNSEKDKEYQLQKEFEALKLKEKEVYTEFIGKNAIDPQLDQNANWGRIRLVAKMLSETRDYYEQDIASGLDPGYIVPDLVYGDLSKMISQYSDLYEESADYCAAMKLFYGDVARGNRKMAGVLVYAFAPGKSHDKYRIGDIIISYGDREVSDYESLRKVYAELGGSEMVKVLRRDYGGLKEIEFKAGAEDIVGFIDIK